MVVSKDLDPILKINFVLKAPIRKPQSILNRSSFLKCEPNELRIQADAYNI